MSFVFFGAAEGDFRRYRQQKDISSINSNLIQR